MKKFLLICLGIFIVVCGYGQTSQRKIEADDTFDERDYITNMFRGNSFISLGGGAQLYFGESDCEINEKERVSPALCVSIGKWFSPAYGVRLAYNGLSFKEYSPIEIEGGVSAGFHENEMKSGFAHLDFMVNLTDKFCGYSERRIYAFIPYIGVGMMHKWNAPYATDFAASGGIINRLSLGRRVDLQLDVMYGVVRGSFDGVMIRQFDSFVSANLGLVFRFGNRRGWLSVSDLSPVNNREFIGELDFLNERINELKRRIDEERESSGLLMKEIKGINVKSDSKNQSVNDEAMIK